MENIRKYRDIKLAIVEKNYLKSERNINTTKFFTENLSTTGMKKSNNHKQICLLGLSILELSKIVICDFWYDYVKRKYGEKAELCYTDRGRQWFHCIHENRWYLERHCKNVENFVNIFEYFLSKTLLN